jgi:hypothetical protein
MRKENLVNEKMNVKEKDRLYYEKVKKVEGMDKLYFNEKMKDVGVEEVDDNKKYYVKGYLFDGIKKKISFIEV